MPDTTYIIHPKEIEFEEDSSTIIISPEAWHSIVDKKEEDNSFIDSLVIFSFIVFIAVNSIFKNRIKKFLHKKGYLNYTHSNNQTISSYQKNYLVYLGKNLNFSIAELKNILLKYHPYFEQLNSQLQETFIERLQAFMQQKIFIIHAKEGYKEMPVLLSAAAIQITFGHDNYLLPYFKYLQIHPEEYFAKNSIRVLAGHVHSNSITVAFNHLLKGYEDYTSGCNVGLHEMAHALYYQEIIINKSSNENFEYYFQRIMQEGNELYEQRHLNKLYSDYAFKELQEFWAESVELFFERPTDLENHFPELFVFMKNILNQNPKQAKFPLQ